MKRIEIPQKMRWTRDTPDGRLYLLAEDVQRTLAAIAAMPVGSVRYNAREFRDSLAGLREREDIRPRRSNDPVEIEE